MIETPSGKGAGDENFPVGSMLLAPRLRPHVAIFYAFARAIDDIADNPTLSPEDKIARLDAFASALDGVGPNAAELGKALRLRESLTASGVPPRHAQDLISAFKQDAVKLRYENWEDLIDYCNRSAAPVGRYLLDLHNEPRAAWPASDALCNALQVINHLQDCRDDYRRLDRVYVPEPWIAQAGGRVDDLARTEASQALRSVFDRLLDGVERLLVDAAPLPRQLKSPRLGLEAGVILAVAEELARRLRRRDPLAERVVLSKAAFLAAAIKGVLRASLQRCTIAIAIKEAPGAVPRRPRDR
jgi:squalene synthase HpnC